jgi:hypothetical protein
MSDQPTILDRPFDACPVFIVCPGCVLLLDRGNAWEGFEVRVSAVTHPKTRTRREQLILILGLAKPLLFAVYADFADRPKLTKRLVL